MLYSKEARLNVPGTNGTQGVVVDAVESVAGFPVYTLRWLTEAGETMTGSCGEGDLRSVNRTDADRREADRERATRLSVFNSEVEKQVSQRLAEIAARRRKASRKPKRKR